MLLFPVSENNFFSDHTADSFQLIYRYGNHAELKLENEHKYAFQIFAWDISGKFAEIKPSLNSISPHNYDIRKEIQYKYPSKG